MARETKVGLLVGIGFIVCFAIILSNRAGYREIRSSLPHSASAAGMIQPQAHTATVPEQRARDYVLRTGGAPRAADVGGEGFMRSPSAPVPRDSERPEPLAPRSNQRPEMALAGEPAPGIGAAEHPDVPIDALDRTLEWQAVPTGNATADGGLRSEDAEDVSSPPLKPIVGTRASGPASGPVRTEPAPRPAGRAYVVQSGDTLSKIAKRFYGVCGTKTLQAIQEANRDRMPNPDLVRTGQTLILPGLDQAAPSETPRSPAARTHSAAPPNDKATHTVAPNEPTAPPKRRPSPRPWRWYQVEKGDLYGTIALKELGTSKRWKEIFELNKDVFPDPSRIRWGVRIKIPVNGGSHPEEGTST